MLLKKTYLNITFSAYFGTAVLKPDFLGLNSGSVGDLLCGLGRLTQPFYVPFLPM